ncbi:hypothetical protein [Mycobacteroides abscessus]|uniref:hypothetical protein n=1 Tax=Mycobacteroides abscessus TaxID=36809 RepID=UPI0009283CC5|nr:hypothetical protein [Mycobacteroides abscessus]MBN7371117.1 hypothetical protein [Mycobacteroides abscessus subsp. abscessus]MBN7521279.1 hypothetical protein [Mycobacteroides abscessus subsp. abscessus]MDB2185147.1 hypothetical protein [Mycobacteroides abscessus subsp. abscessus]MDO3123500.1 hypothetical protein [Mycobacteroides abscessus subsp. abscessus]MDO3173311.1 hypothetical protein [Mycobacteroides abscessus subsp. abscessus]
MSKIKNTMSRAGTGIRKVGAGAHRVLTAGGRKTDAALMVTAVALAGVTGWGLGHSIGWESSSQDNSVMYRAGMNTQREVDQAELDRLASAARTAADDALAKQSRRERGIMLISELPDGVDRGMAKRAENRRAGFVYTDVNGHLAVRQPGGVTALVFGDPGPEGKPTAGGRYDAAQYAGDTMSTRRSNALANGAGFAYTLPDGRIRIDVSSCSGYAAPARPQRFGNEVDATTPPAPFSGGCENVSPTPSFLVEE